MYPVTFEVHRDFLEEVLKRTKSLLGGDIWLPNTDQLHEILRVVFLASLGREEGRPAVFSLSLLPQDQVLASERPYILFGDGRDLEPRALVKLSPATVDRHSALLAGPANSTAPEIRLWGIDLLLEGSLRLVVRAAGRIAIRAALETIAFLDQGECHLVDHALHRQFIAGRGEPNMASQNVLPAERRLFDLTTAMMSHGNGGTILVLASEAACFAHNTYSLARPTVSIREADDFTEEVRKDLFDKGGSGFQLGTKWFRYTWGQDVRSRSIAAIGKLTAVDGAVVVNHDGDLLGFGAIIDTTGAPPDVEYLTPSLDSKPVAVSLEDLGGTRHQSAARFVSKYPGSRAIVASHDGGLSAMIYDSDRRMVRCLRKADWLM